MIPRAYEETVDALMESLVTAVRRLPADGDSLWISLSAGGDSRLVLAAAHVASLRSGPQFRAFTRVTNRMSLADYLLPPKLAREVGCQHEFLRSRRYMPERLRLVSEHAVGHVSEGDALPFLTGERDVLRGITLGGQGFGMGKVEARDRIPPTYRNAAEGAAQLARTEPIDSTATAGLRDWLEWVRETPHPHLDWRDRYYLEQRMAGWQSSKEQIYDMDQHERFFPFNAARSHALMLSIDENRRRGMRHHIDMISRSVPVLMSHQINPPDEGFKLIDRLRVRYRQDRLYLILRMIKRLRGRRR